MIQGTQGGGDDAPLGDDQDDEGEEGEKRKTEPNVDPARPARRRSWALRRFCFSCPLNSCHRLHWIAVA